jgi:signal transduction histidine kinase
LTRHLKGIQVWDASGALLLTSEAREGEAITVESLGIDDVAADIRRALAGESFVVAHEKDGVIYDFCFMPLVDREEHRRGAIAAVLDSAERQHVEAKLRERLAFEELITSLSTHFVNLPVASIDESIVDALRQIGEFAGVDRAYIFRFDSAGTAMDNTHEWCADGIEPQKDSLQGLPMESFPWWTARLRGRDLIHVPDVDALPPEASAERDILKAQSIQSVLALPMVYGQAVVGFLGFDAVRAPKTWPERDIALLRIAGEIFVSALERAAADRARERLEAQLVQSKSLENVARLAGGVAHDFNNLLAIILNYATLLRREIKDPAQREKLGELYETAHRAADLTRQLLLVGRRDIVAPVLLDVNEVVSGLRPLLEGTVGETVKLRLELGDGVDLVHVGRPQLEQVIVNLTLNARDAIEGGAGEIVIRTENATIDEAYAAKYLDVQPGAYVRLRVSDTGKGMAPEVLARAFEPFFTTKGSAGSGLGLATVHGIVKRARGHVAITTELGKGTAVDVFLPLANVAHAVPSAAAPRVAPRLGQGETVLVVEDAGTLRKLVCRMLEDNGYHALEAATPEEALRICEREGGRITMVLTDVIMPQMSGRDLAVRIRDRFRIGKVLFMSGYDDDIIAHQGVIEPGTHLLQKPFVETDLLRAVRSVLDG